MDSRRATIDAHRTLPKNRVAMSEAALRYLREVSASMTAGYPADCVAHAMRLAELLRSDGAHPWIGRIRDLVVEGDRAISRPLIPLRFSGPGKPQWSTHYVCCSDGLAYDPLAGEPVPVDDLALRVFGAKHDVTEAVPSSLVESLLREGTLRAYVNSLGSGLTA